MGSIHFKTLKSVTSSLLVYLFQRNRKRSLNHPLELKKEINERKCAEEALTESEEKYRLLVENANEAIIVAQDGMLQFANPKTTEVTGYSKKELTSKPFVEFIHPDDREMVLRNHLKRLQGETFPGVYPFRIVQKNGNTKWVEINAVRINWEGKPATLNFLTDITEKKQTEEALRESQQLLKKTFASLREAVFIVDSETIKIIDCNPAASEIFGYDREEMLDQTTLFLHTDEATLEEFRKRLYAEVKQKGYLHLSGFRMKRKNGEIFFTEHSVTPFEDDHGKRTGWVSVVRDITERKRAEEALRRSEEKSRQVAQENAIMAEIGRIISSSLNIDEVYERFAEEVRKLIPFDRIAVNTINIEKNTAMIVYAAGKEITDRKAAEIYPLEGSGNAEMVRAKSTLLIQAEEFNEYKDRFPLLLSTFQAGFRSIMNVPLFSKGRIIGGLLLRSLNPYAYSDKNVRLAERVANQIAGAIANAQLFSERVLAEQKTKSLEEELRQSQKMEAIGRLAGGIAHDFNNLLTVIKGYSQLSLLKLKEGEPLKANIEEIQKAADRAVTLTQQLLAFSRRQILEFKVIDLNAILRDMDKMLRRILGEDIELVTLFAEGLGKVKTNPGQIEQMILNLAVNARDAMSFGGKLTLATANVEVDDKYAHTHLGMKPGRYIMLSVSDTGFGMSPEIKEHLFEPFFTTKEKGKGTGLGLSTVYGIVKQSEGDIFVNSEPGQGTTIKIYLPRAEEEASPPVHKDDKELLTQGTETILLVEDEPNVKGFEIQVLRENGYNLLGADNGDEALHMAEEYAGEIHLLLTDVVMPQMGGKELAQKLKTLRPEIKVLFTSGYTDNAIVHHGILDPGIEFLQKPFSPDVLTQKVREVLDK